MDSQVETPKKGAVPLEEALQTAGVGWYTVYIMAVSGFVQFSATCAINLMSMVIPAASCDLGLSGFDKGLLTSTTFLGMTCSSLLFGSLADQFGRRKVMLCCGVITASLAIIASLANYVFLVITWCLNGFLLSGLFSPGFVYVTEFCPMRIRAKSVLIPTCLGNLSTLYLPSLAWVVLPQSISFPIYGSVVFSSWRLYIAILAIPTSVSTLLLYKLPESPKYTLNQGNEEETLRTLRRMYAVNQRKRECQFPISSVILDESDKIAACKSSGDSSFLVGYLRMLRKQLVDLLTPPLLPYTCLSVCMLVGIVGMLNMLFLWIPEQMNRLMQHYIARPDEQLTLCQVLTLSTNGSQTGGGSVDCHVNEDIFIISMVTASIQTVITIAISFLTDRVGSKNVIVSFTAVSTCGVLSLLFVKDYIAIVIINCITAVILSVTYPVGISIVVGFFPTGLRSTAISITMMFARVASAIGSQIYGALYRQHCEPLYWGLFAILSTNIIFNILAPSKRKV